MSETPAKPSLRCRLFGHKDTIANNRFSRAIDIYIVRMLVGPDAVVEERCRRCGQFLRFTPRDISAYV